MNCGENYCFTCLKNIYYKNEDIKEIIEESKENGWICFKCQNKCLCNKCKFKKEKFIDNVVIEIPSQNNLLSNFKKKKEPKELIYVCSSQIKIFLYLDNTSSNNFSSIGF